MNNLPMVVTRQQLGWDLNLQPLSHDHTVLTTAPLGHMQQRELGVKPSSRNISSTALLVRRSLSA